MKAFQKIEKALCLGKSQNEYRVNGKTYMIEISPKEHEDGAITGSIFNLSVWTGKPCGSFRISPDGEVDRGPKVFKEALRGQHIRNLGVPFG
jgi:hypothetical protein